MTVSIYWPQREKSPTAVILFSSSTIFLQRKCCCLHAGCLAPVPFNFTGVVWLPFFGIFCHTWLEFSVLLCTDDGMPISCHIFCIFASSPLTRQYSVTSDVSKCDVFYISSKYGDGMDIATEKKSCICSPIRMCWLPSARAYRQ